MKKLSNAEAELKKSVAYKKTCIHIAADVITYTLDMGAVILNIAKLSKIVGFFCELLSVLERCNQNVSVFL